MLFDKENYTAYPTTPKNVYIPLQDNSLYNSLGPREF